MTSSPYLTIVTQRHGQQVLLCVQGELDVSNRDSLREVIDGLLDPGLQTLVLAGKVRALLEGRFNVAFEDIHQVAPPALRHRLILNFEAEAEGITTDHIIDQILQTVPQNVEAVSV